MRKFYAISDMVNVLKIQTLFHFLFTNKMMVIKKMLVQIANREDPNQTESPAAV